MAADPEVEQRLLALHEENRRRSYRALVLILFAYFGGFVGLLLLLLWSLQHG